MNYSNPLFITGILGLLLIGQIYASSGQTLLFANRVVINEVDIDPQGDDSKFPLQWVELYNPTSSPVNVGGWTLGATTGLKHTYTIAPGTIIPSQQFLVYTYGPLWFPHAGATIQLKSPDGIIMDQTPPLSDQQDNTFTWQRIYDGLDTSSQSDWVFKMGTLGYSNGKPTTIPVSSQLTMSITTDKSDYTFGDTAIISGQVSQLLVNPSVTSIPKSVDLALSGSSGFHKTFTLYPGNDMKFSTTVKLDQVLGFDEGIYTVSGSYGDAKSSSSFSLASEALVAPPQAGLTTLSISTDKPYYQISQPIVLTGNVSKVIPLTPVKYKVYDPTNVVVYTGTLFPDPDGKLTTVNQYQRSAGSSGLLINSVHPIYGAYRISATYADASAFATFTLIPTDVQTSAILISTDKKAYAPGETVIVSGSTKLTGLQNVGLNPSLQIIQTTVGGSSGTQTSGDRGIVPNAINLRTIVNLQSDNTFSYNFVLPGTSDSLGNYRVIVSLTQGIAEADFVVVENPSDYKPSVLSPFSIVTDKNSYALGDHMIISGQILNPIQLSTQNAGATVKIQLLNSTGAPVTSGGSFINNAGVSTSNALIYSTFPDANGNYQLEQTIQSGIYLPGNYTLKASYSNLVTSTRFTVYNPLETGSQGQLIASTDKKVYGVGDLVQLDGKISALTGTSSYTLILTTPTGNQITFPLTLNNGVFSWSWTVPRTANTGIGSIITTDRSSSPVIDPTMGVYGIYRIKVSSTDASSELFFQVSKNPQQNQDLSPIVVQTDKTDYLSTDVAKIWGQVIPSQNDATKEANAVVQVLIYSDKGQQVYRGNANVNQGGQYFVTIPFHTGIWKTGSYKLYAEYSTNKVVTAFNVTDQFATSSTKLQLFITTDKDQYLPGQTVLVTGRTSYIVSINTVDLAVGLKNDVSISEGEIMSKKGNILPKATIPFDQFGSFSYDYKIPNNAALGNYAIVTQVPFGAYYAYFDVVDKLPLQNNTLTTNQTEINPPTNQTLPAQTIIPYTIGPTPKHSISTNMIVEKLGRIFDPSIPLPFTEQYVGNMTYYPRQLDGLLRINPGNENDIGLKISSQTGTCIIGQDPSCLVTKSTVQSGKLYQTVTIDGVNFLVGYSGTGGRLQQFSILPSNSNDVIPEGQWNVDIIKKDQVTRFYYQVTYQPR